jgi:hypothetical protein
MSFQEYSRGGRARQTPPMAAFSAFGDDEDDFGGSQESGKQTRSKSGSNRTPRTSQRMQTNQQSRGVHAMEGDSSKIYNPDTGRYVDAYGKIGQQVIAKYGAPQQDGGFDWSNYNQQISETFGNLYNNFKSTWDSWFMEDKQKLRRQSSHRSIPRENEDEEEGEVYEPLGYASKQSTSRLRSGPSSSRDSASQIAPTYKQRQSRGSGASKVSSTRRTGNGSSRSSNRGLSTSL